MTSRIGESILTRFAGGLHKDLLCEFVQNLSPLNIVTDLRSDPEDPAQWEPGQMGRVHRQSWIETRRRVLKEVWMCKQAADQPRFLDHVRKLVVWLNYMDMFEEILELGIRPFDTDMREWNVLYGPFRGTYAIDLSAAKSAAVNCSISGLTAPLRVLFHLYGFENFRDQRIDCVKNAIYSGSVELVEFLIEILGKPKTKDLLLHAASMRHRVFGHIILGAPEYDAAASAAVFKYLLTIYKIQDPVELVKKVAESRSSQRFAALPGHIQETYAGYAARHAFFIGANDVLEEALLWVDRNDMEYIISESYVQPPNIIGPATSEEDVEAVVKTLVEDEKFNPEFDLDLTIIPLHDRLAMKAFLRHHELYEEIIREGGDGVFFTRNLLDSLLEKWQTDAEVVAMLKKIRYFVPRPKEKSPSDLRKGITSIDTGDRTVMKGLLRDPVVYENISRETLDELIDFWKNDEEVSEMLKDILRRRFQRPPQLEGEPPAKMLKDPVMFYQ